MKRHGNKISYFAIALALLSFLGCATKSKDNKPLLEQEKTLSNISSILAMPASKGQAMPIKEIILYDGPIKKLVLTPPKVGEIYAEFELDEKKYSKEDFKAYIEFYGKNQKYISGAYSGSHKRKRLISRYIPELSECMIVNVLDMRNKNNQVSGEMIVVQLIPEPLLLSPENGWSLKNGNIQFSWLAPPVNDLKLEISKSDLFKEDETQTFTPQNTLKLNQQVFELKSPLKKGEYYWRVRSSQLSSKIFKFEIKAELAKDISSPGIIAASQFIKEKRKAFVFRVKDNGKLKKIKISINSIPVTAKSHDGYFSCLPENGWTEGLNTVRICAEDESGNKSEALSYVTHSSNLPMVKWRKSEGVKIGKKSFFPIGMYIAKINMFPYLKEFGVNMIQDYHSDGILNPGGWFREVKNMKMKAMLSFNRKKIEEMDFEYIAQKIGLHISNRELLAWYLFDEPEILSHAIDPSKLEIIYKFIKALDPSRPVIFTLYNEMLIPEYQNCFDVYFTQAYRSNLIDILKEYKTVEENLSDEKAHCGIINLGKLKDSDTALSAAAITMAKGSGIFHWWWKRPENESKRVKDYFNRLKDIKSIFSSAGSFSCNEKDNLLIYLKNTTNKIYVLAVNAADHEKNIKINLDDYEVLKGFQIQSMTRGLRKMMIDKNSFSDTIPPGKTFVYIANLKEAN